MRSDSNSQAEMRRVRLESGRDARMYRYPALGERVGAIAFSHGNESAPQSYQRILAPWQAAGYEIWAPLHVDSRSHPERAAYPGLATWTCRIEDMRAVSRLIEGQYVAAGHSYGALTALVLGGARGEVPDSILGDLRDPAAACVVALSPPPVIPGLMLPGGYGGLAVPALIQTGDADLMPGWPEMEEGWRVHLEAYEQAAPDGGRYLAFLEGVDHYFGSAICELERDVPPQLDRLDDMVRLSLAFVRAFYPEADSAARRLLDAMRAGQGPVQLSWK